MDNVLAHTVCTVTCKSGAWVYRIERDGIKWQHFAHRLGGAESPVAVDFTPYSVMDVETFRKMVDLGFPHRREFDANNAGPWRAETVADAYAAKAGAQ